MGGDGEHVDVFSIYKRLDIFLPFFQLLCKINQWFTIYKWKGKSFFVIDLLLNHKKGKFYAN